MDIDQIIGCVLVIVSVTSIIALTLWSRRTIERIAAGGYRSARQTLKDLNGD